MRDSPQVESLQRQSTNANSTNTELVRPDKTNVVGCDTAQPMRLGATLQSQSRTIYPMVPPDTPHALHPHLHPQPLVSLPVPQPHHPLPITYRGSLPATHHHPLPPNIDPLPLTTHPRIPSPIMPISTAHHQPSPRPSLALPPDLPSLACLEPSSPPLPPPSYPYQLHSLPHIPSDIPFAHTRPMIYQVLQCRTMGFCSRPATTCR